MLFFSECRRIIIIRQTTPSHHTQALLLGIVHFDLPALPENSGKSIGAKETESTVKMRVKEGKGKKLQAHTSRNKKERHREKIVAGERRGPVTLLRIKVVATKGGKRQTVKRRRAVEQAREKEMVLHHGFSLF